MTTASRDRPSWLFVSGDFTPLGGMDRANHAVALHLARRGDLVHLATHRSWPDLAALPTVSVHQVPRPWGRHLLGSPLLARAGRKIAAELAPKGFRVVVNGGNCAWDDVNWVHYVHAAWPSETSGGPLRRLKARFSHRRNLALERARVGSARRVITNSERTRRDLIEHVGVDPDRITTVYFGSDPEAFAPPSPEKRAEARRALGLEDGRPAVAFVGALGDRRKGFDALYQAWSRLAAEPSWDGVLVVVGAGASLPGWKARAEGDGLAGRSIRFLGFRKDVPEVLAAMDALVSPTRYEAYGLNVHEALCCGLPALVSASAGVAERFPDELRGLLLPDPDDPADLADRLRAWRSESEALRRAVLPTSEALRGRTWAVMAEEFAEAARS